MRWILATLAVLFLAAHLASLPPTLEDLDSVNFALGVRDFDVARHQPHPPGYPAFVALSKLSTAAMRGLGVDAPEVRGLAFWSALGGASLVVLAFVFFAALDDERPRAMAAAFLTAASPLLWFTSLRPLSDVAGLAAAFGALAAVGIAASGIERTAANRRRWLMAGACLAGVAIGFRVQMGALTLPFLAVAVVVRRGVFPARTVALAALALGAGLALWAVPLVVASGGPAAYLQALGSQAGEDFSGVVMVWTNRSVRVAAFAVLNTLVLPWHSPLLAGIMLALAAAGLVVLTVRRWRVAAALAVAFGPYALFHLLFQETVTIRYALPLVPPVAYLAATVLAEARAAATVAGVGVLVLVSLWLAVPAGAAYGRTPSPIFSLLGEARLFGERGAQPLVGLHRRVASESRRAREWAGQPPGRLLPSPRDYEWLEVTRAWREGHEGETWFLADPRRTDLALIDAQYRRSREYRWPFNGAVYVGGARPDEADWHVYTQPGWFLERGWALTPEVAGITERDGWGPHVRPSVGWVRARPDGAVMMIGGRHLGTADDPAVRIVARIEEREVARVESRAGFFLQFFTLPPGSLTAAGRYASLSVSAVPVGSSRVLPVAIEQFDLQAADVPQLGFDEGWHEPEYNPRTARLWRWMSQRAIVRIHGGATDVPIRIRGESPLHYYARPSTLRVSAGGRLLAEVRPSEDFDVEVRVPAAALAADEGRVVLEADQSFVPGEREGTGDRRQLALRIYSVDVR